MDIDNQINLDAYFWFIVSGIWDIYVISNLCVA